MSNDKLAISLAKIVDDAFEGREKIGPKTKGAVRKAVVTALGLLDRGEARVAQRRTDGNWQVNQWLKKAVLLSFRLNDMSVIAGGPGKAAWWDKVDSKFKGWNSAKFRKAGFRAVPGCVVRHSAFIAPGVVLMPSFVNLGAHVDSGTMVDTWATVGSCAQIGKNCHLSGGVGKDEADALKQQSADYALTLEFASARSAEGDASPGAYLADVRVDIRDAQGRQMLNTTAEGPLLLVRLPPGDYTVVADWNGVRKQHSVDLPEGARRHVVFMW